MGWFDSFLDDVIGIDPGGSGLLGSIKNNPLLKTGADILGTSTIGVPLGTAAGALSGALGGIEAGSGSGIMDVYDSYQSQKNAEEYARKLAEQAGTYDPFASQRPMYGEMLQSLYSDPTTYLEQMPGYQVGLDAALKALNRQAAAKGMSGSGNVMLAAQKAAQDYATKAFSDEANRLAALAGANIGPGYRAQGETSAAQAAAKANQFGAQTTSGLLNTLFDVGGSILGGGSPDLGTIYNPSTGTTQTAGWGDWF